MENNKYQRGKIYKIVDNTNGNEYIGSTCEPTLAQRLAKHRSDYKRYLSGKKNFISSFEILQNQNYDIVLLESCPCNNRDELKARERYFIENTNCVNRFIPGRKPDEYKKMYNKKNKEAISKCKKEYYEDNKEKIDQYQKQYREQHKTEIVDYKKQYYEKHKDDIIQKRKQYYEENKDAINERRKIIYQQNKDKNSKHDYEENKELN